MNFSRIGRISGIIIILFHFSLSAVWAQGITAEDIANIKTVGAVQLSADGAHIAYTLSVPRTAEDEVGRNFSELYVIPAVGGSAVPVVQKPQSAGSPQWGADGRLYFTARFTEHHNQTQVYSVLANGEDLQRHTNSPHGLSSFSWTNDGRYLAYTVLEPLPAEVLERQRRGFDMIVAGENLRYMRLWIQPRDGEAEVITAENVYIWNFAWSPDGQRIAARISDKPGADVEQMYTEFVVMNRDGSNIRALMTESKKKSEIAWSPDGARLAVLAGKVYSDPLPQRIWVLATDGSEKRDVTPRNWEGTPLEIRWTDNRTIMFTANESTVSTLNSIRIDRGDVNRIAGGDREVFSSVSLDQRGRTFAAAVHTRNHPAEVYTGTIRRGDFTRITTHNAWLSDRELGRQSTVSWAGADGKPMQGVMILPVGYEEGNAYPLAILPHGGPEGTSLDGWNTRALYPSQLMAAQGYVVFKPNYRGSGGRGTAFASANHRDLGGKEFEDVILGIDYLAERGLVDPNRVGISGTSYGGYFAAWATTRYANRFAAGITFAGLSNWISFMGTTDIPHEMAVVHWDLYWFDNPGQHWERSPVAWLNTPNSPLLVATGLADERVHPEQSLQMYQFLKMKGVPTGLILYPREPHGLLERAHQLDFMERVVRWFGEHL